jgi:uncharacterized membrane protein YcaP (DUF421 family)
VALGSRQRAPDHRIPVAPAQPASTEQATLAGCDGFGPERELAWLAKKQEDTMEWFTPFVTMDIGLAEKVARTIAVYLVIAILLRVAGRRLLAQMNSLDLVVVLLLSNVVQNAIIGPDNSVLGAVIGAVVLIGFDLLLDLLTQRSRRMRHLLEGRPVQLVQDGTVDRVALARVGIRDRELALALSRQGIDKVAQVRAASLETAGDLLVDLKPGERPVTRDDLAAAVAELKDLIAQGRD